MRTYFVAVTRDDVDGTGWHRDFAVFDDIQNVSDFMIGKAAYNALDDSTRLHYGDELVYVFCILAEDVLQAYHRAYDLRYRA